MWYKDLNKRGIDFVLNSYAKKFGDYVNVTVAPAVSNCLELPVLRRSPQRCILSMEVSREGAVSNMMVEPPDEARFGMSPEFNDEVLQHLKKLTKVAAAPKGSNANLKLFFECYGDRKIAPAWHFIYVQYHSAFDDLAQALDCVQLKLMRMQPELRQLGMEFGITIDSSGKPLIPVEIRSSLPIEKTQEAAHCLRQMGLSRA